MNESKGLYNLKHLQDITETKTQFRHVLCELGFFINLLTFLLNQMNWEMSAFYIFT